MTRLTDIFANKRQLRKKNAALRKQTGELTAALEGLLGLVNDNITTAKDLHEVHTAEDALDHAGK